jgi:hypothetical protein
MPDLARLAGRFEADLTTLDGRHFRGRVVELPENAPTSAAPAKRLLRVHPQTFLTPGTLVTDIAGLIYVLAEGVSGQWQGQEVKRTFRMIRLDRVMTWERLQTVAHPVAGVAEDQSWQPVSPGTIRCLLEPATERLERSYRMSTTYERWKLYTDADLRLNDQIDGRMEIVRVEKVAGVTVADVQ